MNIKQEIKDRINYFYKQTDGTYKFPNSSAGDILKLVAKSFNEEELAYREAVRLAKCIWRENHREDAPDWEPLDTTEGVISQINNMYAGIREENVGRLKLLKVIASMPEYNQDDARRLRNIAKKYLNDES